MRAVISLGGSILVEGLSASVIQSYADIIEGLVADGHEIAVVVGGGPIAREYIDVSRTLGADEVRLDELGIEVTRLNARLLIDALGDTAYSTPPTSYAEAGRALKRGDVPVLGGIAPAQTTDAVSAATAEYVDAEVLVYATSVDGVFSGDPNTSEDVTRYDEIEVSELVSVIADIEMSAGSQGPVDMLAAKIIQRGKLRAIVMDGTDPAAIGRAVRSGEHAGTDIVVEGMTTPSAW